MSEKEKYKICLVGECLSLGGAEKTMALLSQYFVANNIAAHTVIVVDDVVYDYAGELLNLGKLKNKSNGFFNKLKRFRVLKKYIAENDFDFIIDFRIRTAFLQEFITAKWLYTAPTIYTVHSSMTDLYFPKSQNQAQKIYKNAFGIVAVSKAIEQIIHRKYDLQNTTTIHNPIAIEAIQRLASEFIPTEQKYIIAAGRMKIGVKQFDKLIVAYSKSDLPKKNIKLMILGDGEKRESLEKLVSELQLENFVIFTGHVDNPYPYMKNALFFVLSSAREGLPTVILESLACGTPVVSFDCISGPSEMIVDGENGILVGDQNFDELTTSMNKMISDTEFYNHCKQNAKLSVARFSLENIGKQWLDYLKIG